MKILLGAAVAVIAFTPFVRAADTPPDPKVRMAQIAKEDVEKAEKEVARTEADTLKDFDAVIAAMKIDNPAAEKAAMAGMKELAARGRKLGKAVLDGHAAYTAAAKGLKAAYTNGPATFRDAAATFRRYAGEEPFEDIKKDYLACAATWETLAAAMEKRVKVIEAEEKEIAETMKFVERSVLFLGRFESFADAYPAMVDADQRAKFLEQLRRYVETYEQLRGNLGKFHDQLKKQALAPDLRPKPGDAVAATDVPTGTTPANPAVPDGPVDVSKARDALRKSQPPAGRPPLSPAVAEDSSRHPAIPASAVPIGETYVLHEGVVYRVRAYYAPNPPGAGEAVARR